MKEKSKGSNSSKVQKKSNLLELLKLVRSKVYLRESIFYLYDSLRERKKKWYVATIFETIKDNDLAKKLASSGFRDMTRLAMSNTQMAEDMLIYNRKNIDFALDSLKKVCENLKEDYREKIEVIAKEREKMYSKDGKNIID